MSDLDVIVHMTDQRDREQHLSDAAVRAASIIDHAREIATIRGSDGKRIAHRAQQLSEPTHPAWPTMRPGHRTAGQDTLRILTAASGRSTRGQGPAH